MAGSRRNPGWVTILVISASGAAAARGGSHLWEINEIFTNHDGTIQFIELKESMGAPFEIALAGHDLISVGTGNVYHITQNLIPPTSNKHLLFGTPAFAALPGAPTPDYIIPPNFFVVAADTIDWEPNLNYDTFTFAPSQLPNDGVNSIHITNYTTDTFITAANSPTNYNGDSETVNAGPAVPVASTWGLVAAALLLIATGTLVARNRLGSAGLRPAR
jgi:hypothetical protein